MSIIAQIRLKEYLMGNSITASALETLLASASYRSAWQVLCNRRSAIRAIAASTAAMAIVAGSATANADLVVAPEGKIAVFQSGRAIKAILDNTATGRPAWAAAFDYAVANTPGLIKLKRTIITASSTWTYPTHVAPGALVALRVVLVGTGGGSAAQNSNGGVSSGSAGGGGGEIKCVDVDPTQVTGNVSVTLPPGSTGAAGGAATFGALASAAGGGLGTATSGTTPGTGGAGGGAASSGNWYDEDLVGAFWQDAANVRGGTGGNGNYSGGPGATAGGNATSANAKTLGLGGTVRSAGAAYGGAGSGANGGTSTAGATPAGTAYGAGSSGAQSNGSTTGNNAPGMAGIAVVHHIEP